MRASGLILVTGANGFIGRHLTQALADLGFPARGLIRPSADPARLAGNPKVVRGDLLDHEAINTATAGVDTCIHLAALSSVTAAAADPDLAMRINTRSVGDLLAACRANGVRRFVLVSTIQVFGPVPASLLTESSRFDPHGPYATSKLEAERLALGSGGAMEVVVLRPSNVYGPGQSRAAVVADFVAKAVSGEPMVVRDPAVQRNFVYVGDAVSALIAAASEPAAAGHAINIVGRREVTIGHVAKAIWRTAGHADPSDPARAGDDDDAGAEPPPAGPTLAESLLGWRPVTPLAAGLSDCVEFERSRRRPEA
jgi:nucleoside-diphosphate-sugar epimerase